MSHPATEVDRPAPDRSPAGEVLAPTHRLHLDGVRAVAVYLVVLFHAGIGHVDGGYIGVDVFFVLSGYLVTTLLLRDLEATGSIRFRRFYARRVRRLLPAALVVLAVTAVVFAAVAAPAEWPGAQDAIRAAALYVSNWYFIAQATDYFAADINASPVLHFWSLSVEEQFYIVWPVLLLAGYRVTRGARRPRRLLQALVAVAALLSVSAAVVVDRSNVPLAYFGTGTRAYQLLAGALLALAPGWLVRIRRTPSGPRVAGWVATASLLALVVSASWLVSLGPVSRGVLAAAVSVALIVSVEAATGGITRRFLSLPPMAYLGQISYGTYLWHWLVVIVLARETGLGAVGIAAVTIVVATGLASLSYALLEHPVRSWAALDRHRGPVIAVGLVASVLVGVVVVPRLFDRAATGSFALDRPAGSAPGAAASAGGRAPDLDWRTAQKEVADAPACTADTIDACTVVRGSGPKVLLIGDSHAGTFLPMVERVAKRNDLELSVASLPACGWIDGVWSALVADKCRAAQADWYGPVMDAIDPDIVILTHRVMDQDGSPTAVLGEGTDFLESGTDAFDRLVEDRTRATVAELRRQGRKVVIIEPIPQPRDDEQDPLQCVSKGGDLDACRFVTSTTPGREERLDRSLDAADDQVWSLDLDRDVCPYLPICDPVVGGRIVRRDHTHLTLDYSAALADAFERRLEDQGILR